MKKSLRIVIMLVAVVGIGLIALTTYLGKQDASKLAMQKSLLEKQEKKAMTEQMKLENARKQAERERQRELNQVKVALRSKVDLYPGEKVKLDDFEWVRSKVSLLPKSVITKLGLATLPYSLNHAVVRRKINVKQFVSVDMLKLAPSSSIFVRKLKPGMSVYAVAVNLRRGVGGLIEDGTRVNIMYEYKGEVATIAENVRVIGTRNFGGNVGFGDVYLEVTPRMAQMLKASEGGAGKLSLLPKAFRKAMPPLKVEYISHSNDLINKYFIDSKAPREGGEVKFIRSIKGDRMFFHRIQGDDVESVRHQGQPKKESSNNTKADDEKTSSKSQTTKSQDNTTSGDNATGGKVLLNKNNTSLDSAVSERHVLSSGIKSVFSKMIDFLS